MMVYLTILLCSVNVFIKDLLIVRMNAFSRSKNIHCCVTKIDKRKVVFAAEAKASCIFSTNYTLCTEGDCWTQVNVPLHTFQNGNHRSMLLFSYDCELSMEALIKGLNSLKTERYGDEKAQCSFEEKKIDHRES